MRKREKERIAKARRELRNATKRLESASKARMPKFRARQLDEFGQIKRESNNAERDAVIKRRQRALADAQKAKGKLEAALRAPSSARLRDTRRRPERYSNVKRARFEFEVQAKEAERDINRIPDARLTGKQGEALRRLEAAREAGQDIDDIWEEVRDQTGLRSHDIFTIWFYS